MTNNYSRVEGSVKRVYLSEGFVLPLDEKSFDHEISTSSVPVLVDFWASWCGPCALQAPILDQFAADNPKSLKVRKVEIDEAPFLAERFEITNVPTMLLFVDGKVAETIVGARPLGVLQKDLKSYLQPQTKEDDHGEHLG